MAKLPGALAGARIVGERFVHSRRQQNPTGGMSLVNHLRELRSRIVKMALPLAAGMAAGFAFFLQAWHFIERPLCSAVIRGQSGCHTLGTNQLVLDGPLDSFYLWVKVAFIVGIVLSSPIWLYQIWAFVAPGLYAGRSAGVTSSSAPPSRCSVPASRWPTGRWAGRCTTCSA